MPINIIRGKVVVLGDPGVGKTALVQMLMSDGREFPKSYAMTLGVDLQPKKCHLPDSQDMVEMLIYDCGGLELYVDCLSQFWDQPDMVVVVMDVCMPASLQSVTDWYRVAQSAEWAGGRSAPLAGLLFANKTDLSQRRLVSTETASQLAAKLGLHYVEGSAKENEGVKEAFLWLAEQLYKDSTRPSYSALHKTVLKSLSNSSLK